ncbi:MAG TPA: hypothetical protein VIT92_09950 [Burkholderiaceae bacterium]
MKPLRIDFARPTLSRALLTSTPAAWLLAIVTVLCVAAAGYVGRDALNKLNNEQERLDRTRAAHTRLLGATVAPPAAPLPAAQVAAVNAAIAQLNLPWGAVFDTVEAGTPNTIALIALQPDPAKRLLRATAEAKNADEMIAYIQQLKQQEFFSSVVLRHHEVNEQDPNRPLRFEFEATWQVQP